MSFAEFGRQEFHDDLVAQQAGCTERRDRVVVSNPTSLARRR